MADLRQLIAAALAEQEQANTGERGGFDIRPTRPVWAPPPIDEPAFVRERPVQHNAGLMETIIDFLRRNPVSVNVGGRGVAWDPTMGGKKEIEPSFNERQKARAASRNVVRAGQQEGYGKEAAGVRRSDARIAEYEKRRAAGAKYTTPRLTTEEVRERAKEAAAGRREGAPLVGRVPAKPRVGGPLPSIANLASGLTAQARRLREAAGGVSSRADSLDSVSNTVRTFHAKLREAMDEASIMRLEIPDRLSDEQRQLLKEAIMVRLKQVSGGNGR